jgi:predicted DNA-binding transcriptional regulator AlpA
MWDFVLRFKLPEGGSDPEEWLDRLFEAGCDDATIGTGKGGSIALDFSRQAGSAEEAVRSAISDVLGAIPGAQLLEASPDVVNLADLATIIGCSRQNVRKYAAGEIKAVKVAFPEPVYASGSASLWRLAEVLPWFDLNTEIRPPRQVMDLSKVTSIRNLEAQHARLRKVVAAE